MFVNTESFNIDSHIIAIDNDVPRCISNQIKHFISALTITPTTILIGLVKSYSLKEVGRYDRKQRTMMVKCTISSSRTTYIFLAYRPAFSYLNIGSNILMMILTTIGGHGAINITTLVSQSGTNEDTDILSNSISLPTHKA